jgi:acetyl-CoA acyltransferase
MADDLWIIGVAMTKFMRYKDKDLIDLGSEAATAALADAGLSIFDADILAAGCLYDTNGIGQRIQKQIGQTGIPVYNVTNACATGATAFRVAAMAIRAGEASIGLAVGLEQMGKLGLLGAAAGRKDRLFEPAGRYGAVGPVEGVLGTSLMPGTFAQSGMEYAGQHDGVGFEQFAKVAEKNHALGPESAGAVPEGVLAGGGDGGGDDRLPQYAADVLPDRGRRGRGGGVQW